MADKPKSQSHVLANMKVSGQNVYPIEVNSWIQLANIQGKDFNSELVCNRFADCEYETDEADLKLIQFLKCGNETSRPSLSFHSNGKWKYEIGKYEYFIFCD